MSRLFHDKNTILNAAKNHMSKTLKIPSELVYGDCIITFRGNHEVYIENYKGILECNETFIWLSAQNMRICFEGHNLIVSYYNDDEMKISGLINQVMFME